MPYKLAAHQSIHPFWYKQNVSPPKDYANWDRMIREFAQHLVDRYGIDEVAQWYFEVWNEPNIDFWAGDPKQATYFELYDHTARALKRVSPRRCVLAGRQRRRRTGFPTFSTRLQASMCQIDFVSTHGYADDTVQDLFGTNEDIPMRDRVCRAVKMVHGRFSGSSMPTLPLYVDGMECPLLWQILDARDNWYVGTGAGAGHQ